MDFAQDFAGAQDTLSRSLIATTRAATNLSAEDLSFHRSLEPSLSRSLERQSARLLALSQSLIRNCAPSRGLDQCSLPDADAIDAKWRLIVDIADDLLERTDTCLDEFNGLLKRSTPRDGTASPAPTPRISNIRKPRAFNPQNLSKPQLLFHTQPAHDLRPPFKPFLNSKPHARIPLVSSIVLRPNDKGELQYLHPYEQEIADYEYPSLVYSCVEPIPYTDFDATAATFVEDWGGVIEMLAELKTSAIIAIDLEHHDAHSYHGLVSLMQISTRKRDWIIDTLKPWRRKLEVLNEVFANPGVLKVLHGAFMDIIWLQRDLGLYIVGLFDTHHASRALGYPGGSLAYLLKRFVDFDAQKQYQTADWRMRPLPQEMFDYARSDTHFLLYIFDHMRNDLVRKSNFVDHNHDKVQKVLEKSKETALQRYEYPEYDMEKGLGRYGWFEQLQKTPTLLSKEQLSVFRRAHCWRDQVARKEDESPHQIMPKHALVNIAKVLPRDMSTLLGVSHPISQAVRSRASELLEVIGTALADSADGPDMLELLTSISDEQSISVPQQHRHFDTTREPTETLNRQLSNSQILEDCRSRTSGFWGPTLAITKSTSIQVSEIPVCFAATPKVPDKPCAASSNSEAPFSEHTPVSTVFGLTGTPAIKLDSVLGKRKERLEAAEEYDSNEIRSQTPSDSGDSHKASADANKLSRLQRKIKSSARDRSRNSANNDEATGDEPEQQFFNYRTASSMLNAAVEVPRSKNRKKQKPINPYTKASDALLGANAEQRPKTGKSFTFG